MCTTGIIQENDRVFGFTIMRFDLTNFSNMFLFYEQNSIKSLSQLEQCVDLAALDAQFQRACCGQNDYIQLSNGFSGYNWVDVTCSASPYNVRAFSSIFILFRVSVTDTLFTTYRNPLLLHYVLPLKPLIDTTFSVQCSLLSSPRTLPHPTCLLVTTLRKLPAQRRTFSTLMPLPVGFIFAFCSCK